MVIISKTVLIEFAEKHPDSIGAINEWWEKTKAADWSLFQDIKSTFNSVDYVGNDRYVFNIKGNPAVRHLQCRITDKKDLQSLSKLIGSSGITKSIYLSSRL